MFENYEECTSLLESKSRNSNYDSISYDEVGVESPQSSSGASGSSYSNISDFAPTEPVGTSTEETDIHSNCNSWSRQQWMILITQNSLILTSNIAYSMLSTFFPQQASTKGVSSLVTGFIFGIYEFVIFLTSPIFGALTEQLTLRYMCLAGSFLSGGCCILFGFLPACPDGAVFIVMCFIVRIISAAGASMSGVSSYAILSITFPDQVAIVNSIAETIAGLGFMIGPVVGGFLYDTGGFILPFLVLGIVSLLSTLFAFLGPADLDGETGEKSRLKFLGLLSNPGISLLYVHVFGATLALTFLDPIFSPWLELNFSLSVTMVGLVFLIWSGVYTVLSPLMGKLTDKGFIYSLMIGGSLLGFLSLLAMGPSPIIKNIFPAEKQLWMVCLTCVVLGVACAAMFIPPYVAAINLVTVDGYTLDTNVYGMISGLVSSSASLGAFAGPTLAGYLNDQWGFEWSVTACAFIVLIMGMLMIVFCVIMSCKGRNLAPHNPKHDIIINSNTTSDKLYPHEVKEVERFVRNLI